jgi:ribonuclease-3
LEEALTHRSYANSAGTTLTYERLEFLGDSVLGVVVAAHLYRAHPEKTEGELTKLKASLVNLKTLTAVARRVGIASHIKLSPEEDRAGGRRRGSILSDVYEAVLGAIYLDGGLDAAQVVIERTLLGELTGTQQELLEVNYKGELLEYLQGRGEGMPRYEVTDESGPDHQKTFTVVVHRNGQAAGRGIGSNKKEAEQRAAREALRSLGILSDVLEGARQRRIPSDRRPRDMSSR